MALPAATLHLLLLNSHDLASLCKEVLVIIHEREREREEGVEGGKTGRGRKRATSVSCGL